MLVLQTGKQWYEIIFFQNIFHQIQKINTPLKNDNQKTGRPSCAMSFKRKNNELESFFKIGSFGLVKTWIITAAIYFEVPITTHIAIILEILIWTEKIEQQVLKKKQFQEFKWNSCLRHSFIQGNHTCLTEALYFVAEWVSCWKFLTCFSIKGQVCDMNLWINLYFCFRILKHDCFFWILFNNFRNRHLVFVLWCFIVLFNNNVIASFQSKIYCNYKISPNSDIRKYHSSLTQKNQNVLRNFPFPIFHNDILKQQQIQKDFIFSFY